ncbi:MAG: arsenate reductase family protein [Anaerofustis stercorihominis]|nr:arsenate reductase family protein [Anaerofustis stercorihominis]
MLFVNYPKCTTCRKAKKFLDANGIDYISRHIAEEKPTKEELSLWIEKSGEDIKKFFNTSGKLYKDMNLKDKLKDMSYEEKLGLLSTDGMLVKRPILVFEDKVLVGFKEDKWLEAVK